MLGAGSLGRALASLISRLGHALDITVFILSLFFTGGRYTGGAVRPALFSLVTSEFNPLLAESSHEGWLEVNKSHYHTGSSVEIPFKWGHNMQVDGLCVKDRLTAQVIGPKGETSDLNIKDCDGTHYIVSFVPEYEGYHQVVVEQNGIVSITADGKYVLAPKKDCINVRESIAFTQFAKAIVPVGHHLHGTVPVVGNALELVPQGGAHLATGDTLQVKVLYKGEALTGADVTLLYGGPLEGGEPVVVKTTPDGMAEFLLPRPGKHLVLVRHTDLGDVIEGQYDQRRFTATLPVMVSKK